MVVIRVDAPPTSPISFGVVKQVLLRAGLRTSATDRLLAQSLRLYFPLDQSLAERVRGDAVSLTDGATAEDQIRYSQRRRVRRNHIAGAAPHIAGAGAVRVDMGRCHAIAQPSREFLE